MKNIRQTSLPTEIANPINRNPSQAKGFTTDIAFGKKTPVKAPAQIVQKRSNFYSSIFSISPVSQVILGHNPKRSYIALQNKSLSDIYLSFGTPATIQNGFLFAANDVWTFENGIVPDNSIYALTSAASATLSILEGTYI